MSATLRDALLAHVAHDPRAPLLIASDNAHEPGLTLDYGEMLRQARRMAGYLAARGIARGDKIALLDRKSVV